MLTKQPSFSPLISFSVPETDDLLSPIQGETIPSSPKRNKGIFVRNSINPSVNLLTEPLNTEIDSGDHPFREPRDQPKKQRYQQTVTKK